MISQEQRLNNQQEGSVGPSIILGSGNYFNYLSPETSHWTLEDVAYGLGGEGRWAGQVVNRNSGLRDFFFVAQHCVMMAGMAVINGDHDIVFKILNHENEEAFCGDMSSMLKRQCPDYKTISKKIGRHMNIRMGVGEPTLEEAHRIKQYDLRMMATERQQLTAWQGERWELLDEIEPFPNLLLQPWAPRYAAEMWLDHWAAAVGMSKVKARGIVF